MIMISLHQFARVLLALMVGVVLMLAWSEPALFAAGDLAEVVGGRVAALYAFTSLVYLAFPTRRRVDLTCMVIFTSWAFELRDLSGAYELLTAKLVGDTLGAAAVLVPSYVERLRALDRSGGEIAERRRWRPVTPRPRNLLGLPAPARAPFGSDRRQK
jgi:hypothetical protein